MRLAGSIVALLLGGCARAGTVAPMEQAPVVPVAAADPVARSPAATVDEPVIETGPAPAVELASLSGYVMSREASPGTPERFAASVTAVAGPEDGGGWRFTLTDAAAKSYELKVVAPASLPSPLRVEDRVQASVRATGGGPNMRYALMFQGEDGGVLLAVNEAPKGWKVVRGKAADVDRGPDYVERTFGVSFEHAGVRVTVEAGAWARMDVSGQTYHVWGSAAQRKLRPGKRPMPDYVEAWLDFAVVRAR